MRFFVVLTAAIFASALGFFTNSENSPGKQEAQTEEAGVRCAKKIAVGPRGTETACLMQKRKARA
ncbi:hypothetical protein [Methylocystis iwaonis]|uniref:Uncharacterized protein n=1 Tax=Methylocystis iwaonis TaxID=2885079 RepID=A0ABM8E6E1_9HYPH|nr:hypothetical protein [Methylocystis iwaonis]BDV33388.1 hypothetical protein SS37A_09170 [Methylocystis iwaonis]